MDRASGTGTGLDAAAAMARLHEEMRRPPFNRWLALTAVAADPAEREIAVTMALRPELCLDAEGRIAHGGVVAALIDAAGHAAVAVWHGQMTPTIALQVDYLAPAVGPVLQARGRLRKLGRSMGRADVDVFSGDRLVAIGRGNFSTRGGT